jgi:hypothetical protein
MITAVMITARGLAAPSSRATPGALAYWPAAPPAGAAR